MLEEKATSGLSRKRLAHQTERFLSVADKLYPAWQVGYIEGLCPTMFVVLIAELSVSVVLGVFLK